jgi:rRNA biogenesis protein RRP5
MQNVKVGEIYDKSRVLRMDKRAGLFLEIPSPTPSPGFVSVCVILDTLLAGLFSFKKGPSSVACHH